MQNFIPIEYEKFDMDLKTAKDKGLLTVKDRIYASIELLRGVQDIHRCRLWHRGIYIIHIL